MPTDEQWMRLAADLAIAGQGRVEPNPMVGCVLVRRGVEIGRGHHAIYGGPHAEAAALAGCDEPAGSTAYVTLEPCCHHGKTPPCADALITAGIRRVVVGSLDPSAKVNGGGIARLRAAGIDVDVGVLGSRCDRLIAPFVKTATTGLPWIIAKWAMTADGRIATATGHSRWITGGEARRDVHRVRGRVDAIAIGVGTAIADDPSLTVRLDEIDRPPRQPIRVVFCRRRFPPADSRLIQTAGEVPVLIVQGPPAVAQPVNNPVNPIRSLVGVNWLDLSDRDPDGWLVEALRTLAGGVAGRLPMTNVVIEGGSELLGQFRAADLIDEAHVYVGGKLFGGRSAPGPLGDPGVDSVATATALELRGVERMGNDVKLTYQRGVSN